MKKALLLKTAIVCSVCASVLILVICSCNRYDFIPVAYGDLVFIDGMALYQGKPFTGNACGLTVNGDTYYKKAYFKNGLRSGTHKRRADQVQAEETICYQGGKKNGASTSVQSNISYDMTYKDDLLHGVYCYKEDYEEGDYKVYGCYKRGVPVGTWYFSIPAPKPHRKTISMDNTGNRAQLLAASGKYEEAVQLLHPFFQETEHPFEQAILGNLYYQGYNGKTDYRKACTLYESVLNNGKAADFLDRLDNMSEKLFYYHGAKKRHELLFRIGWMYEHGDSTMSADRKKAVDCYRKVYQSVKYPDVDFLKECYFYSGLRLCLLSREQPIPGIDSSEVLRNLNKACKTRWIYTDTDVHEMAVQLLNFYMEDRQLIKTEIGNIAEIIAVQTCCADMSERFLLAYLKLIEIFSEECESDFKEKYGNDFKKAQKTLLQLLHDRYPKKRQYKVQLDALNI